MLKKIYGRMKDKESLASILDDVGADLKRISEKLDAGDRSLLEEHMTLVREMEKELEIDDEDSGLAHPEPELDPGIELVNDNTPRISRMQIDLIVAFGLRSLMEWVMGLPSLERKISVKAERWIWGSGLHSI